eukprot:7862062-Pyramimonas_sp.AAC.1
MEKDKTCESGLLGCSSGESSKFRDKKHTPSPAGQISPMRRCQARMSTRSVATQAERSSGLAPQSIIAYDCKHRFKYSAQNARILSAKESTLTLKYRAEHYIIRTPHHPGISDTDGTYLPIIDGNAHVNIVEY